MLVEMSGIMIICEAGGSCRSCKLWQLTNALCLLKWAASWSSVRLVAAAAAVSCDSLRMLHVCWNERHHDHLWGWWQLPQLGIERVVNDLLTVDSVILKKTDLRIRKKKQWFVWQPGCFLSVTFLSQKKRTLQAGRKYPAGKTKRNTNSQACTSFIPYMPKWNYPLAINGTGS
jgi:hypothetical protein